MDRLSSRTKAGQPIHGDYQETNPFFAGGRVSAIIDWEQPRLAPPAWEVGRALDFVLGFEPVRCRRFVGAYRAERALSLADLDAAAAYDRYTRHNLWIYQTCYLFGEAARPHRRRLGKKWRVDETYCDFQGKQACIYGAIDQDGQVVDAYFSERRNAAAAQAFFERAMAKTDVTPVRVTTDKAKCYPPALRADLPGVEHRRSKYLNNGLERDHAHLKQRRYPMRSFQRGGSADTLARGHALIRNLRGGFSRLTATVTVNLRLATAWPRLSQAI